MSREVESPKSEIRNPKEARSPKSEKPSRRSPIWRSDFGFLSGFGFRASDFWSYVEVVEKPWRRSHFLLELDEHAFGPEDVGDFAVRIEDVAELPRAGGTDFEARGVFSLARALDAEMAFLHHALPPGAIAEIGHLRIDSFFGNLRLREVEPAREVRTRGFAIATPDAPVVINHRDAVLLLPGGVNGTNLHAGRVFTLLALHGHVEEIFFRHLGRVVIVLGLLHIERAVGHFQ